MGEVVRGLLMLVFGLGGFVSLVGEGDELHLGHVPDLRALIPPKALGLHGEVWPFIPIQCPGGVVDERLCNYSDGTVKSILHHRPVSETYQTASMISTVALLPPEQSVSKSRPASSSSRSRSC
jgi:hypothetical protein